MSYANPRAVTYRFPEVDFGAAISATNGAFSFKGPKGLENGRILDIGVGEVSEAFACDLTPGIVQVGTGADPDAYAKLNIADALAIGDTFNTVDDTDAVIEADIPGETQIEVLCVIATDGTAVAGKGRPYIVVEWY